MANSADALPAGPYVVLGGPPFESSANQTSLQMFDAIGAERPVIYVCRRYQGSVLRRLVKGPLGKTSTTLRAGLHSLDENRHVLVLPWMADLLPMVRPELSRQVLKLIVRSAISNALIKLQWDQPVLVTYWWMFPEIVGMKLWRFRVFDVIDRHWGYSYESSERARQRNFDLAVKTVSLSDRVKCVSKGLIEELEGYSRPELLPNAIDLARVNRSKTTEARGRTKTAVYAGGWNERLDVDLLLELVERNPDWQFSFVGAEEDYRFARFNNVRFFGDVSYDTVLEQLSQAQIGLIPFVSNAYTESSNFLKILDYLATGVTIGSTKLTSLAVWAERYPSRFKVLVTIDDWDDFFKNAENNSRAGNLAHEPIDMHHYDTRTRAIALVSGVNQPVSSATLIGSDAKPKRAK